MTNYILKRSNRKTLALNIRNGIFYVRAPYDYPQADIDRFIAVKEKWIQEKLALSQKLADDKKTFCLNYGSEIHFCGKLYPIVAKAGATAGFDGKCFFMPPGLIHTQIKEVCIKTYHNLAKMHLQSVVPIFAKQMCVTPTAIKVNNAKTRWGSCSNKKTINFSWRLIMADNDVIDYVVVHELAHILQMNHSENFWNLVENVLPDYKQRLIRLKELQKRLVTEDWE